MRLLTAGVIPLVVLVSACVAPAQQSQSGGDASAQARMSVPKVLTIAEKREPEILAGYPNAGGSPRGAGIEVDMAHNQLVVSNDDNVWVPQLATEQISVERGTWRVNSDGTMETTWRLRPNVRWHDGAPFTSADLLFTYTVSKDPALPNRWGRALEAMESASAPDPLTFVIRWSKIYVAADEAPALGPLPRHLVEDLFLADKERFRNSPPLTSEFIGLGPYRLVKYEPGSHAEFAPFDGYYLGRPPLDTVIVRYVLDGNAMMASILSGVVDIIMPPGIDIEGSLEIKRRWEGTGNIVRADLTDDVRILRLQQNQGLAKPANGFPMRAVRQAFYHALDRQGLTEVMTHGQAPAVDSWFPPFHPQRAEVDPFVPRYPYDLNRARQLLAEVGWTRGADGVLVHQTTGDRFETEMWADTQIGTEKEVTIIADQWKAVGAAVGVRSITAAQTRDRSFQAQFPFAITGEPNWLETATQFHHGQERATQENNWTRRNISGYANPRFDAIADRLAVTVEPRERLPLHQQLLQEGMGDVAFMPLYWSVQPLVMVKGVKGPQRGLTAGWNFYQWDRE